MARSLLVSLLIPLLAGCAAQDSPPCGPYFDQAPPAAGGEAKLFALGIVSTGLYTRDLTLTPDGRELYFCVVLGNFAHSTILVTRQDEGGCWSTPEVVPFATNPDWKHLEPHVSPDGEQLFYMSDRPAAGETEAGDANLWVLDRSGAGWGEPRMLGAPVNTDADEYFASTTRDGTLYFTREDAASGTGAIFRARRLADGGYGQPERLGEAVNSTPNVFNAFVDPDERFLIVPTYGREDSHGRTDYYVCFPDGAGGWEGPYNLGDRINTADGQEYSCSTSPDGRWLFFMAARPGVRLFGPEGMTLEQLRRAHGSPGNGSPSIYWIDADVIEAARP